ncbi:MAG: glycosyltransferase, partial [Bacteroidetes bacterium]|nr:glycosyltransferase [Bacteroidota bacterium]
MMTLIWIAAIPVALLALFLFIFGKLVIIRTPKYKLPDILSTPRKKISENFYSVGKNRLKMNRPGLWEMYIEGAPLERGIAAGKLSQEQIHEQEDIFFRRLGEFVPVRGYLKLLRFFIGWFDRNIEKHITEEYRREIFGISMFASDDYDFVAKKYQRYLNLHAAHDIGRILQDMHLTGCTAFAAWGKKTGDGNPVIGRNFDFYIGDEFAANKIVNFYNPDKGYKFAMIGWGGMIGAVSGMNETGLTLTINGSKSKRPGSAKTPTSILGREILQYAASIDDAIEITNKRSLFVSESYLVCSAKENRAVVIEISPYRTSVLEPEDDFIACSNHFQTTAFKDDKQNIENIAKSDSVYRLNRVRQLVAGTEIIDPAKAAGILRNRYGIDNHDIGLGNEKAVNQFIGHHSVIMQPGKLLMWVSTSPYQMGEYVCYDLSRAFGEAADLETDCSIHEERLTIPTDPFAGTNAFRTFMQYRLCTSPMYKERQRALARLDNTGICKLISSNPGFYMVYSNAGDRCMEQKDHSEAVRYFRAALTLEMPTLWDKTTVGQKLDKAILLCKRSGIPVPEKPPDNLSFLPPGKEESRRLFDAYKCCILIPTYNNGRTLAAVLKGVLEFTGNIIVVNDGSTDETAKVLEQFPGITVIGYPGNKGKGYALRKGFVHALRAGYNYAVTIDSDGQHLPEDLPLLIRKLEYLTDTIVVGARNMDQAGIPGKSTFGYRFSNFWYRIETGIRLPDTQSGFRLYPLQPLEKLKLQTNRFEFETEVLVRAAWRRIGVTSVPVRVRYTEDRVTHFRPFQDFVRAGLL